MPSEFILWVDCRVDLATRQTEAGRPQAIGVVSVALRRDESNYVSGSHLSGEPFTFLETEKDEAPLVPNVEAAAKDAIKRSVLDYVIASNK
jgi:hypothetical protein